MTNHRDERFWTTYFCNLQIPKAIKRHPHHALRMSGRGNQSQSQRAVVTRISLSLLCVCVCVRLRSCAFLHTRVWFSATCNRWTFSCFAVYSNRKSCHLMMFSENLRRKKIIPSNMRIHLRCDLNKSQVSYYFRRFCPFYCHAETFSIHNFLFRSTRLESWL